MAKMNITQLDQKLRSKELVSVYLITGAEAHLRRTAVDHVVATARHLHEDLGEVLRFDAQTHSVGDVLEPLQSGSLFASQQVIVVSRTQSWKADDWLALSTYCTQPSAQAILVIETEKVDLRGKGAKVVAGAAVHVECKPLYANQVPQWIRMECQRRKKPISQDAAALLAEAVGTELGAVDQAIEKLMLYCGNAKLIDRDAVEQVILETSQRNIFDFTGAVGQGNAPRAMKLLEQLLHSGESAVMLTAMLARHWRLLCKTHSLQSTQRMGERELAQSLKVHPFFVKEYVTQARRYQDAQLRRGFRVLRDTDRALKRSRASHRAILSDCVLQLMPR